VAVAVPPQTAAGVPPHNEEAEASVLGAILLTEQALDGVLLEIGLRPEHFYRPRHQRIFEAMIRLKEKAEPEAVDALVAAAVDRYGRVDVLVNNAAGNFVVKAEDLSPNGWRAVVGIVLDGSFLCSRAAGRRMIEQGEGGAILSVIASYAWTGGPGTVHSAAAKAGVQALTKTLAVEWAEHGIRANCICPGPTDTEGAGQALWPTEEDRARVAATVPLGRLASPEEVAVWAAALCSPYAGYITGETLTIDGGHWLEQESYLPALGKQPRG